MRCPGTGAGASPAAQPRSPSKRCARRSAPQISQPKPNTNAPVQPQTSMARAIAQPRSSASQRPTCQTATKSSVSASARQGMLRDRFMAGGSALVQKIINPRERVLRLVLLDVVFLLLVDRVLRRQRLV